MAETGRKEAVSNSSAKTENIHTVEKVLKQRFVGGKPEYLLKWVGFSAKHNSWEPEENVVGNVLVEEFNRKETEKGRIKRSKSKDLPNEVAIKAKTILGSILVEGQQMFFVDLENATKPGLFTARLANQQFPQLVIDYYESIAEKP